MATESLEEHNARMAKIRKLIAELDSLADHAPTAAAHGWIISAIDALGHAESVERLHEEVKELPEIAWGKKR